MHTKYKRPPERHIAVDAEWLGKAPDNWKTLLGSEKVTQMFICLQTRYIDDSRKQRAVMLMSDRYDGLKRTPAIRQAAYDAGFTDFVFVPHDALADGLLCYLPGISANVPVRPWFFNSPIDIAYLLGVDNVKRWVEAKKLTKRRCYRLEVPNGGLAACGFKVSGVRDIVGLAPKTAEQAAQSVGFDTLDKTLSHHWDKGKMQLPLVKEPIAFMRYAKWDIDWIAAFAVGFPSLMNTVRASIGLTDKWGVDDMPNTMGAMVYKMFEEWLVAAVPDVVELQAAIGRKIPGERAGRIGSYSHGIVDSCSVPVLAKRTSTVKYSAVVLGGRCVNERPTVFRMTGRVADIDLKSCYGSSLASMLYPLGLPSTYGGVRDDKGMTLGDFLKRYESELVDGLWTVNLCGELPFDQNLLFSKRVTERDLERAASGVFDDGDDEDPSKVAGIFTLSTRVLENASLDCYSLEVIRKFSTSNELNGWMNLKVLSAAWYPRDKRIDDQAQFSAEIKANPGTWTSSNDGIDTVKDKRNRHWLALPLKGFIQPLLDKRSEVKHTNKPLDQAIKLPVNTLYGDIASPYFPIGNAVVANNITGRARVGAWMMAMSLGSAQSITDGGAYDIDNVRTLNVTASQFKRPGFQVMFSACLEGATASTRYKVRPWDEGAKYGRGWKRLSVEWDGLTPWDDEFDNGANLKAYASALDTAATRHINEFFSVYGLRLPFSVEHKEQHFADTWATYGKSDYAAKLKDGKPFYKVRGGQDFDTDPHSKLKRNTRFDVLDAILEDRTIDDRDMWYNASKPVTPSSLLKMKADEQRHWYTGLYKVSTHEFQVRIAYLPFDSIDSYLRWSNMNTRQLEAAKLDEWRNEPSKLTTRAMQLVSGRKRNVIK